MHAAFRHALYEVRGNGGVELSAGYVVEKVQRFRSVAEYVVHAHGHAVNTDRVVFVQGKSDIQFGADAVGSRNDNRLAVSGGNLEHAGETPESVQDSGNHGPFRVFLVSGYGAIAFFNIYSGFPVINHWVLLTVFLFHQSWTWGIHQENIPGRSSNRLLHSSWIRSVP